MNKKSIIILLLFSFLTKLFNSLASPIFPDFCFQIDNALFYMVGRALLRGKVLYLDLVDNKSPYIYFINSFASLIEYKHIGLYIIESLFLFFTLIYVYKIIDLYIKKDGVNYFALIGAIVISVLINDIFLGRGMSKTEAYVLPFMIATFYKTILFFKENNKYIIKESLIFGLFSGFSFMFNQKSGFYFLVLYAVLAIYLIINKRIIDLVKFILFGILGAILSALPYIIYMIATHSTKDAIECIFMQSIAYADSNSAFGDTNYGVLRSIWIFITKDYHIIFFAFILLSSIVLFICEKSLFIKISYFTTLVTILIYSSITKQYFTYYLVTFIPYLIPLYIFIVKKFSTFNNRFVFTIFVPTLFIGGLYYGFHFVKTHYALTNYLNNQLKTCLYKYYDNLDSIKILAPGYNPDVYMGINLNLGYKYYVTMPNKYEVNPKFYDEQMRYVVERDPDIIVINKNQTFGNFPLQMKLRMADIIDTDYEHIGSIDSGASDGVYYIYKKRK